MLIGALGLCAAALLFGPSRPGTLLAGNDSPPSAAELQPRARTEEHPDKTESRLSADGPGEFLIRAHVVGPVGERIEGACVVGFGEDPDRRPWKAKRLPDESFELAVDAAGSCWVTAIAPGWSSATPVEVELGRGERVSELELHLNGMLLVRGQARWKDGKPVADAAFVLSPQYSSRELDHPRLRALLFGELELGGRTAGDGSFVIPGLAPGVVYTLELTPDARHPDCCAVREGVDASQGPIELSVDAHDLCGTSLRGTVAGAKGEVVKTFRVQLWRQFGPGDWRKESERAFQSADGRYELRGLREGCTYAASIDTPDSRWNWIAPFTVAKGASAHEAASHAGAPRAEGPALVRDVHPSPGGAVVVSLRSADGREIQGALVEVRPDVVYPIDGQPTHARADGAFELRSLAEGAYRVEVRLDDGAHVERTVDVHAGAENALEIVLGR